MYIESQPDVEPTAGQLQISMHQAAILRNRADAMTRFRDRTAPLLGFGLAFDNGERPILTIANTALTATDEYFDIKDGINGRKSDALLGRTPSVEAGEADHKADKKKFVAQMLGLVTRTVVHEQDYHQASIIGANGLIQIIRDRAMARTRQEAIELGIDGKARKIGKGKAWANGIGAGLHTITPVLPEKAKNTAQKAGNVALTVGTILSLTGLADMKMHVHRSKKELARKN